VTRFHLFFWSFAAFLIASPLAAAPKAPQTVAVEIDSIIDKAIHANKIPLAPAADDAEFLRRASLDITGRIPTFDRTVAFLKDASPDKRAKLIDELLAEPEYGEHLAIIWYHRIVKIDDDNRLLVKDNKLKDWLETNFNKNHGWNKIVSDILMAQGPRDKNPETTFFFANVEDVKGRHDPAPNKVTTIASKLFLGIRLECCECHNHPFNTMKQTDYWGVAAFFTELHSQNAANKDAKDGVEPSIHEGALAIPPKINKKDSPPVHPFGSIGIPDSKGKTVKAKYLGGAEPPTANHPSLRRLFVNWLTAPQNKYFAPAAVNKMWANFFGRGIVNPVDDMVDLDQASHPELLKLLSNEFVASGYDLKYLVRCICNSKAYQRTSTVTDANKSDKTLYSHMPVKVMSADMLYDSLQLVLGTSGPEPKGSEGKKKAPTIGREGFRRFFHAEADDDVGVVEEYTHGVPQVLRLMNSFQTNNTSALAAKLMKEGEPERVIESMYLTILSRKPTAAEQKLMMGYAGPGKLTPKTCGDLSWVLLNSGEFLFNH
jgi:Protein of unknown function (DUF1549)/Protein of unknown function (DUF1553)